MNWLLYPKMNENLFLKDPQQSEVGKKILTQSVVLIRDLGFEAFTFKKLAEHIKTTEATVYRYFENKHRLLVYIVAWYWHWLDYQVMFDTHNITDNEQNIRKVIDVLTWQVGEKHLVNGINMEDLHAIIKTESSKVYLTKHVSEDNQAKIFKPYKDLCERISNLFLKHNPNYLYPRSLASTVLEMAHLQDFFMFNLPSLTDFSGTNNLKNVRDFLISLVFSSLNSKNNE